MKTIKIKYHADIPKIEKITKGDWIDLRAAEDLFIPEDEDAMISLGVSMELPEGYEAIVAPRSSTYKNFGIVMTNGIGIIDNSYCGTNDVWKFPARCLVGRCKKHISRTDRSTIGWLKGAEIRKGDRICQFRIQETQPEIAFVECDKLGDDRGGFGSTGIK